MATGGTSRLGGGFTGAGRIAANSGATPGLAAAERHSNNAQERGTSAGAGREQGAWLNNRQYQEYLSLLRERTRAQPVVSVPLERVAYPTASLQAAIPNRPAYGVSQPGYTFLAPSGTAAKASGYAGMPSPMPVGRVPQAR